MSKELILLTGYTHFFGQTRKPWVSIDTTKLISELVLLGYQVSEHPFHFVFSQNTDYQGKVVFYTFSHRPNLRLYLFDIIYHLSRQGAVVVPPLYMLQCYENKGYQELLKKELGISNLKSWYLSSKREIREFEFSYPLVLKTLEGSNAQGVYLVKNEKELLKKITKLEPSQSIFTHLDLVRRRFFRRHRIYPEFPDYNPLKDYYQYKDYIKPEIGFVLQQFIPNLEYDYRIVIMGDHVYISKRLTRKNDFRASGSKKLIYDFEPESNLLNYIWDLYQRFNTPMLALDVGESEGQYYLFEFQAQHFGIRTILNSRGYYQFLSGKWQFSKADSCFEKEIAYSLDYYLHRTR